MSRRTARIAEVQLSDGRVERRNRERILADLDAGRIARADSSEPPRFVEVRGTWSWAGRQSGPRGPRVMQARRFLPAGELMTS